MIEILDTHVHLWDPSRLSYPWLAAQATLNRQFLLGDLDSAGLQLSGCIVVEAGAHPDFAEAEMAWIEEIASEQPRVRGFVAHVPLEKGVTALEAVMNRPLVAGVRRNVQDEAPGFMLIPDFVAGVGGLARVELPFDACVREHQLSELGSLVERNPSVMFVLDHLGKPDIRQRRRAPWVNDVAALARHPNVFTKLSGLTTEADWHAWRPADILPYLRHAIDVFGPDRCMYGSDWPVATLATSYPRWVEVVLEAIVDLPLPEQTAVLIGTAERVYRPGARFPVDPRS